MNIWILFGKCCLAERSTSPWVGSEVSKTQAILSSLSLCFLVASCGSRSEPLATVPATIPSLCHDDSDPLEPQSHMSSLATAVEKELIQSVSQGGASMCVSWYLNAGVCCRVSRFSSLPAQAPLDSSPLRRVLRLFLESFWRICLMCLSG